MMKKLLLIFMVSGAFAQNYNFSVVSSPYSNLTGSTSLNNGAVWDNPAYTFPIGFNFQLYSTVFNSASLNSNGDGGVVSQTPTPANILPVLIPMGTDIIDRGFISGTSLSNISYKLDGAAGSRICKLEWKNVGFYGDLNANNASNDFANFQMWLYETTNIVEFRYGPSTINAVIDSFQNTGGASVAIFPSVNFNTGIPQPGLVLSGPANAPIVNTTDDQLFLIGMPANGTIYRFTPSNLKTDKFNFNQQFTVYPNPISDIFSIIQDDGNQYISIVNVLDYTGKTIKTFVSNFEKLDISNLQKGIYIIEIKNDFKTSYQKIVKN